VGATGLSVSQSAVARRFRYRNQQQEPTMPYDDDVTSTENPRDESARAKRSDNPKSTKASPSTAPFGEIGPHNVKAAFRLQMEMFEVFHDVGRDWLKRAASEAELAFNLPNKLTAAQTVPAALSAYQEWLSEWMSMVGEDGRHFIADGQKIVDRSVSYFADRSPGTTT
jgi:hypothetical protein